MGVLAMQALPYTAAVACAAVSQPLSLRRRRAAARRPAPAEIS
jgi:hypothetical protein